MSVLFCSLAVLDPKAIHNMDVLSLFILFISVFCHSDWFFHGESCPRTGIDVVHPGRACMVFLACVHLALFLALSLSPGNFLVSSWCDHSMLTSLLRQCPTLPSTLALIKKHSFVFFAVYETCRIFLSPFISKASRRVYSFFPSVQLLQPYVATGHTSAFISRIFVEIGMLWLFRIFPLSLSCRRCIYGWLGLGDPPAPVLPRRGQDDVISVAKVRNYPPSNL